MEEYFLTRFLVRDYFGLAGHLSLSYYKIFFRNYNMVININPFPNNLRTILKYSVRKGRYRLA